MRTIHKYPLGPGPITEVEVPRGGRVVHVALQRNVPCAWVEVDDARPVETRRFDIVGTGTSVWQGDHVGTFMTADDALVFHVYASPTTPEAAS